MEKSAQTQLFRTTAWMQEVEQRMEQLSSRSSILGQSPNNYPLFPEQPYFLSAHLKYENSVITSFLQLGADIF